MPSISGDRGPRGAGQPTNGCSGRMHGRALIGRNRRGTLSAVAPRLTDAHMLVLGCLARNPSCSADDVAETLGVSVALVLALVADLEAAGCIERAPSH